MDSSHFGQRKDSLFPQDAENRGPMHDFRKANETRTSSDVAPSDPDIHAEKLNYTQRSVGRGPSPSAIGGIRTRKSRKTLVLCFDGTGNQFRGDSSDSNILKVFRMLDRSSGTGYHYYQPGIGTYVADDSLSAHGSIQKLKNWYLKVKDAAVGTSFDEHVVGGYKFLMQYYSPGDNIYMFGFSRGSYTARFLAEMIDWVGLITHGNEEMIQFAWRTFSKWKSIHSNTTEARQKQKKAYDFMVSFRETFSRPVRRIRFLGLFDTVNSVPRFENAILSRQRVPFSAISSAKIIRHAVSIDERRAKFRADLCSHGLAAKKESEKPLDELLEMHGHHHGWVHRSSRYTENKSRPIKPKPVPRAPEPGVKHDNDRARGRKMGQEATTERPESRYREHSHARSHFTDGRTSNNSMVDLHSTMGSHVRDESQHQEPTSWGQEIDWDDDISSDGDENEQDIDELWFPGGHADIGGGWEIDEDEIPLSHPPLVWIVNEARKSGLEFDEEKMATLNCLEDTSNFTEGTNLPTIELVTSGGDEEKIGDGNNKGESKFESILLQAATEGVLHDCLRYGAGSPATTVLRWRIMERLPFRRLDLTEDGKWKPIRWPLPRGEVRDMPDDAKVHISAIRRMEKNPEYRPGNLILGGGGRGVKKAPKEAKVGEWLDVGDQNDLVAGRVVRKPKLVRERTENGVHSTGVQRNGLK